MTRKLIPLAAALALAAGCDLAKKTTYEGPGPQCRTAGAACTANADCCSYGCSAGVCVAGTHEGTVCKTTNDCGYPDFSYTQMLCKSGHCSVPALYCRDNADVCTAATECCSHHCSGSWAAAGACIPNQAPVVQLGSAVQTVPRNQDFTLVNTSYDPDAADTVTYGWTITPVSPPTATGWSLVSATGGLSPNTEKNPIFRPGSTLATYLVRLDVTDNWGLTSSGTVTLNVVNTSPVLTGAPAATVQRNVVPAPITIAASDANNDPLACTWTILRPDGTTYSTKTVATFQSVTPVNQTIDFPTGLAANDEGTWTVRLSCDDGSGLPNAVASALTAVTVVNTTPAVTAPTTQTLNLASVATSTPSQPIAAAATDANGDAIVSWNWTVSPATGATLTGANTATIGFAPTTTGVFTLTATACDGPANYPTATTPYASPPYASRPSACGSATVTVTVYPYIRRLADDGVTTVSDAAFAKGTNLERLVVVGPDSTKGALWQYDLLSGAAPLKVALIEAPTSVGISSTGNTAVTAGPLYDYKVALGATPAATQYSAPASAQQVTVPSDNDAYFTYSSTRYVDHVNLSNGSFGSLTAVYGTWATAIPGTSNQVFIADRALSNYLYRYAISGNGSLSASTSYSPYTCGRVWSTNAAASSAHIVDDCGNVYLASASPLALLATTLQASGLRSVDSSPGEGVLLALTSGATSVRRYGSAFTLVATDALPHWGYAGADRPLQGLFAFVSNDGKTAYVVVETTAAPIEYGLYTYALP